MLRRPEYSELIFDERYCKSLWRKLLSRLKKLYEDDNFLTCQTTCIDGDYGNVFCGKVKVWRTLSK